MNKLITFHQMEVSNRFLNAIWDKCDGKIYLENSRTIKEDDILLLVLKIRDGQFDPKLIQLKINKIKTLDCMDLENALLELTVEMVTF